ncbi:MAG TPA: DUF1835 domain-containing protein [Mucilaginibacter sp.]|jgi:hypothetical protein|nr:DUF1835 domain-containing protein [Mucilaginibacter sp.]
MRVLHILNGDSTAQTFAETGLEGDVLVWREVLSEGPLIENITSAEFWRGRSAWIGEAFSEATEGYQQSVLNELTRLEDPYDEINLWFEFDLHCQVNMLGVMNYLRQKTDLSHPAIFLICPDDYPGKEDFRGMGELTADELEYLYDNIRTQLSEIDFVIAAEAWAVYVSHDAEKLKNHINNTQFWGSLHCLKPALAAQLKRLHVNERGLNTIEQKLFEIYQNGYHTWPEILSVFWQTEKIYGMGDMEVNIYLQKLIKKGLVSLSA